MDHGEFRQMTQTDHFCMCETEGHILSDGVSVCDAAQHHALYDGAVFFFRQAAMGHQRSGQLGGRGGVDTLQPLVALDLI